VNETGRFRITAKDFFEVNNQLVPSVRMIEILVHKFKSNLNLIVKNCYAMQNILYPLFRYIGIG